MEKTMSIHQALAEIKTYDARIERGIRAQFVLANKKSRMKIGSDTVKEAEDKMSGALSSVFALIENKKRIKSAITKSNNETIVSVGADTYTVSEAIDRKNMIMLEDELLATLTTQFKAAKDKVDENNDLVNLKLESYLQSVLSDKTKVDQGIIDGLSIKFRQDNEYELIDPCNLDKVITSLYDEVTAFKMEVDYKLSESNSVTFITIELVD
ncbi:MAG: hypothetical protein RR365_01180 [Bacteroides sp.]